MNKVLIITYYWPPSGGAGVQRWLKFAKYLPEFGWTPLVLTVDPDYAAYPVTDDSLGNDLPTSVKVFKTPATDYFRIYNKDKSKIPSAGFANNVDNTPKAKMMRFIRGNFFIPDPRKGWNKFAIRKASEIIETEGIRNVITTSPPHSTQLIGLKIKRKYPKINWIADLRDPWTDIYYYNQFYPTFISRKIDSAYEKSVLKTADRIITVGPSLKASFSSKYNAIEDKIEVITNGYDEDDFQGLIQTNPELFTITYTGTLSEAYPIGGFLEALHRVKEIGKEFRLRFIGTVPEKIKELVLLKTGNSSVEFVPYVDHSTAVKYMLSSTILLLIIPDHKSNKSIITGKLFEYIASARPILCLGPSDGDTAEIIKSCEAGKTFNYDDINLIEDFILASIHKEPHRDQNKGSIYSRKELSGKISEILN